MNEKPWMGLEMYCEETGKMEPQFKVRGSEDGIYLRCGGCGKVHGHEIGEFSYLFSIRNGVGK
jgi:uncharacterized Zn finger protein